MWRRRGDVQLGEASDIIRGCTIASKPTANCSGLQGRAAANSLELAKELNCWLMCFYMAARILLA